MYDPTDLRDYEVEEYHDEEHFGHMDGLDALASHDIADQLTTAAIDLCQEMMLEGVDNPLTQPVMLAALLADLFRHLGQPVPAAVAVVIG